MRFPRRLAILVYCFQKGMRRRKVLLVNLVSAFATVVAAVLVYGLGGQLPVSEPLLLAVTAGFFIYIAASDIIPTIHAEPKRRAANLQAAVLLLGVIFVGLTTTLAHQYIGGHDHSTSEQHIDTSGDVHEAHHDHNDESHADDHHDDAH